MVSAAHRASSIEAIIFDVDGVLTDGGLYRSDDGQEMKRFHAMDGLGIRMLSDAGVEIAIITGRTSQVVAHRCEELQIKHVCLLYTSPSPRDRTRSRMPSSA